MSKEIYLIIAISILVLLVITFFVSFVLYKRTPLPKGCENLKMDEEKCSSCSNEGCMFHKKEVEE